MTETAESKAPAGEKLAWKPVPMLETPPQAQLIQASFDSGKLTPSPVGIQTVPCLLKLRGAWVRLPHEHAIYRKHARTMYISFSRAVMCFQVKGLKRKQRLENMEPSEKKAKSVSATEAAGAAEPGTSTAGASLVHAHAGKENGFYIDENQKPMFREYDLTELPAEARPHPNKVHAGKHGFTVVSSNYADARITIQSVSYHSYHIHVISLRVSVIVA